MKKTGTLLLAAMVSVMMLAGCGSKTPTAPNQVTSLPLSEATAPIKSSSAPAESSPAPKLDPIKGDRIKDGTYAISVSSSSSMFRIIDAQLTVVAGEMTAVITLSGDGYGKLYMGTGEQALADTEDKSIPFVENPQGKYTYTLPISALNQEIDVAAWSIKKEAWYDRVLVFESNQIPLDAIKAA